MLATKEAGKALADALATNSVLTELDVSGNATYPISGAYWDGADGPGFVQELAVGVSSNETMTSLNISSNNLGRRFDGNEWISDPNGIQALAAAIPECR